MQHSLYYSKFELQIKQQQGLLTSFIYALNHCARSAVSSGEATPRMGSVNNPSAAVPNVILLFAICHSPIWSRDMFRDCCGLTPGDPGCFRKIRDLATKPVSFSRTSQYRKSHIMIFKLILVLSLAGCAWPDVGSYVVCSKVNQPGENSIDHDCHCSCHWYLSSFSFPLSSCF